MRRRILTGLIAALVFILSVAGAAWLVTYWMANVPIRFYGKVSDEDGKPLAGVTITAEIVGTRGIPVLWVGGSSSHDRVVTTSRADGTFELHGRGTRLDIIMFAKPGYDPPWAHKRFFEYSFSYNGATGPTYHADPPHPVTYPLFKREEKRSDTGQR